LKLGFYSSLISFIWLPSHNFFPFSFLFCRSTPFYENIRQFSYKKLHTLLEILLRFFTYIFDNVFTSNQAPPMQNQVHTLFSQDSVYWLYLIVIYITRYPLLASLAPGEPKKKVTNEKMKFQIHTNYYYYYYYTSKKS